LLWYTASARSFSRFTERAALRATRNDFSRVVDVLTAAVIENSRSGFGSWQRGHAGVSPIFTSSSKRFLHLRHLYS